MTDLTETEVALLRWMVRTNAKDMGLYGPAVKRTGPLKECERLLRLGLADLRLTTGKMSDPERGYFITPAGRVALAEKDKTP